MADHETSTRTNGAAARAHAAAEDIADTPRRVRAAAEPEVASLEDQVAQLQSDLKSITVTLNKLGASAGNELRNTGKSAVSYAQDEFEAVEKQIKDTIREKPLTAVAGALAAGFILAVLTR